MFRERFSSQGDTAPADRIDVEYIEGPFRYLNNHWSLRARPGGCRIDFYVDFEFKSRILQNLIGLLFNEAVHRMVAAFEARAHKLYRPVVTASAQAEQLDRQTGHRVGLDAASGRSVIGWRPDSAEDPLLHGRGMASQERCPAYPWAAQPRQSRPAARVAAQFLRGRYAPASRWLQ